MDEAGEGSLPESRLSVTAAVKANAVAKGTGWEEPHVEVKSAHLQQPPGLGGEPVLPPGLPSRLWALEDKDPSSSDHAQIRLLISWIGPH